MDDIPTSYDENTSLAKYLKRITESNEIAWSRSIVETHRDDWDISSREEMDQSRPDPMIKPTRRIWDDLDLFLYFVIPWFLSTESRP